MKKYIYLISPQKIKGSKFYEDLNILLKTKKVKFFQLRLKKISTSNLIKIAKKIKKITKKKPIIKKEEIKKTAKVKKKPEKKVKKTKKK